MSSDPILDAEAGIESNQPREIYEIVQSDTEIYRIASGARDVIYNGFTFVAQPAARTDIPIATHQQDAQLTLALPMSHPFAQRYMALSTPPTEAKITIYRQQVGIGIEPFLRGFIVACSLDKHLAKFTIRSRFARAMQRRLPIWNADTFCHHVLYDQNCRVNRAQFLVTTRVSVYSGRTVSVEDMNHQQAGWATFGEFWHTPSGEKMTIVDHYGVDQGHGALHFTLQAPIVGIKDGDLVQIFAGCAHDISACGTKFGNQVNYGGFPALPVVNPFDPAGVGINQGNNE